MIIKTEISKNYILIILFIIPLIKTEKFSCKKIFPKFYKVFKFNEPSEKIITKQIKTSTNKIKNKIIKIQTDEGIIKTNICGLINIPTKCNMTGEAKLLYIPKNINKNKKSKCLIIKDDENWEYKTNLDNKTLKVEEQSLIISNKSPEIILEYFFICNKNLKNKEPFINVIIEGDFKIRVDIESYKGCAILLNGYYILEQYNFLTGSFFFVLGFFFLFFGRKWQNKFPSIFRSILLVCFCFFIYFTFIENFFDEMGRIYMLLVLFCITIGISYLIVSYKTACLILLGVFSSLEIYSFFILPFLLIHPVFSHIITKIIFFCIFLVIHAIFFVKNKIMFKILTTCFLGSIFILFSLQYFTIFDMEFFFIIQNNFLFDIDLDIIKTLIVTSIFIITFLLGISIQKYYRYLEIKKFDGSGYHKIDLNF